MAKTRKRAGPKSSKKADKEKSEESTNEELNQDETVADEPNVSSPPPSDTGKENNTAEAPEKTAASDEKASDSDAEGSGGDGSSPKILNELDGTLGLALLGEEPVPETEPVKPVLRLVPLMMLLKPEVLDKPAKATQDAKARKSSARARKSTSYIEISSGSSSEAEQISLSSSTEDEDARRKSKKGRNGGSSKENNSTNSKLSNGASKKTKELSKDISINLEKMPANVNRLMKTFKVEQEKIESWSDTDDFENMISTTKIDRNAPAKPKEVPKPVETVKQAEPVLQKSARSSKKTKKDSEEEESEASLKKVEASNRRKRPERNSARNARIKTKTVIESDEKQTSSDSSEEDKEPLKPTRNAKKQDPPSDTRTARRGRKAVIESDPESDAPAEKPKVDDKKSSKTSKKKKTDDDHAMEKTKKGKREKSTSSEEEEEVASRGRPKKTKETQQPPPSRTTRTRRGVATTPERSSPRKGKADLKIKISLKKKALKVESSEESSEEKSKLESSESDDERIVKPVKLRDALKIKKKLSSDSESALSSPEQAPETKAEPSESEIEIPEDDKLPILDQKLRNRNKFEKNSVFETLKSKIEQRKAKKRVSSSDEEIKPEPRRQNGNASEKNNNDDEPKPADRDEDDSAEMTIAKAKSLAAKRKRLLSSSDEEQKNGKSESEKKKKKMNSDSEYEQSSGDEKAKDSEGVKSEANSEKSDASSEEENSDDEQPKKRKIGSDKDSDEEDDDDEELEKNRPKEKRRKRIKKVASSDEDADNDKDEKKGGRKNIRKLMKADKLDVSTKEAGKIERDRKQRIDERQKLYNQVYDERPEELKEITKLVLDFDEKSKKPLLEVDKKLVRKLKPHQANGVKFMWDACFESLDRCESDSGSGCILAHCMGLGKTLQVITLVHTLLKNSDKTGVNRVLVVCPLSTVLNWVNEFNIWLKDIDGREDIYVYDITKLKQNVDRANKLMEWHNDGGIMILSYDMFRNLTNDTGARLRKKVKESLQTSLVDPGPDLVVCDEGHLLKNEKTSISKAMMKLKTLRRIVLTGTPLQNNLKEYYCMVQFVKPNLLGKYQEYLNRFVNPITNGQYTDSTDYDIQVMRRRAHVLHKMLDGCVQRRDYGVLSPFLPPKHEYVLSLKLSPMQIKLYKYYMANKSRSNDENNGRKGSILFTDFQNLQRIWTAPLVLRYNSNRYEVEMQRRKDLESEDESEGSLKDFIDDSESAASTSESSSDGGSEEDAASINSDEPKKSKKKKKNKNIPLPRRTRAKAADFPSDHEAEELVAATKKENPTEWWMQICPEEELNNIEHSSKLTLLMSILEECEAIGDKLLVFSQSLYSLDVIEHFLNVIDEQTQKDPLHSSFTGSWTQGQDYFRLDGSTPVESRNAFCKHFNSPSNPRARLFLISTRAGGLGINLVAANRVIIFDVSWNPSHDIQSIFRVYRFGQTKPCYVYRFLALGTMEEKIYERQVTKQAISKRVIDEQQIDRHYNSNDLQELYNFDLEQDDERILPILPKDRLFAEMLRKYEDMIYKYHEHDTLLENKEEETLGEEERKQAWEEFEMEKNRPQFVANYVPQQPRSNGPVTSNNIFGIRTDVLLKLLSMKARMDHPNMSDMQVKTSIPLLMQELYRQMDRGELTLYQQLIALSGSLEVPQNYGGQFRVNENLLSQAYSSSMPSTSSYAAQLAYQQQQQATRAQIDRYAQQQRQTLMNQLKNRKSPPRVVGSVIEID